MKVDYSKVEELIRGYCSVLRLDYYEFIRPSKSPKYCRARAILINYLINLGLYQHEVTKIFNLERSNIGRNNKRAKENYLKTQQGKEIKKKIEVLVFRQSIGVETIFKQITREKIIYRKKNQSRAFMTGIENK